MQFMLGCNYWASNGGTEMWVNWDENVIDADLKVLSVHGLKYLRVFPNWRDFQPVCAYYGYGNEFREYRHKDGSYFDNPYYIDMTMMKRFERFCEIAEKYEMKLIVGLLTGWMSGRVFCPPLLDGKNLFRDETALLMEQKFIKGFVSHFCRNSAILAWDLGNECNCMSQAPNRQTAAAWTAMVVNAIKANDPAHRKVISGLHGMGFDKKWDIIDHGEWVDVYTTHPYPHFVQYCYKDDILSFRTLMHATCQGLYFSGLGGKPCLTEEIGTLGPMTCDDAAASAFLQTNLYSNWVHGSLGVFWWCGCEQVKLNSAPYTWCMMERELGLMDTERKPKATLLTYKKFSEWMTGFGKELPAARVDAVCILTKQQPQWGAAYMSFALAKQAHVNIQYVYGEQRKLPDSKVYLLPSIAGTEVICKETFDMLLDKVNQGATLYISNDNGYLAEFEKVTGVHVCNSMIASDKCCMHFLTWKNQDRSAPMDFWREKRYIIEAAGAEILAVDDLGMPVFTRHQFGKGTVYYLNFPLETMLLEKNYAFSGNYYEVYNCVFEKVKQQYPVSVTNKYIGVTCHETEENCYAVLINYSQQEQKTEMTVNEQYEIADIYGGSDRILAANEAVVVTLKKKEARYEKLDVRSV